LTRNSETIVHLISSDRTFDETDPSNVLIIMPSGKLTRRKYRRILKERKRNYTA